MGATTIGCGFRGAALPFLGRYRETQQDNAQRDWKNRFRKTHCLCSFDAATKCLGFRLLHSLSGQHCIHCTAQFLRLNFSGVARIVDAPVIEEPVVAVEEVSFRRNCCTEFVGNLVTWILQDGETELVVSRVRLTAAASSATFELIPMTLMPLAL